VPPPQPPRISIDPDVRRAATLPGEVYADPAWFALQRERVFARKMPVDKPVLKFAGPRRPVSRYGYSPRIRRASSTRSQATM